MSSRSIYRLDRADIRQHVGRAVILQRGRGYAKADRVCHLEVRDDHLHARVSGTYGNTYKVEIWYQAGELLSTCTCPYAWGVCKHVAATLWTWLNRRAQPEKYKTTTTAQQRRQLEAIPPAVLIDQIMDDMRLDMMLERTVRRWLEKLSPDTLPKLIGDLFRQQRTRLPMTMEQALERVAHILLWAESLSPDQAIKISAETLKLHQTRPEAMVQPEGSRIITQALGILCQCLPQADIDAPTGRKMLRDLTALAERQHPAWQALLEETILRITDSLGERSMLIAELRKKELLGNPDLLRLLARLYKLEGRMEDYEATRRNSLKTEIDYLELFQYYVEDNRPEEAMILGEQGVKHLQASAEQLAQRLTALYLEWDEHELARKHLLCCFDYWPSEELFKTIGSLSKGRKGWKSQRARLRKRLKQEEKGSRQLASITSHESRLLTESPSSSSLHTSGTRVKRPGQPPHSMFSDD